MWTSKILPNFNCRGWWCLFLTVNDTNIPNHNLKHFLLDHDIKDIRRVILRLFPMILKLLSSIKASELWQNKSNGWCYVGSVLIKQHWFTWLYICMIYAFLCFLRQQNVKNYPQLFRKCYEWLKWLCSILNDSTTFVIWGYFDNKLLNTSLMSL